MAAEELVGLSAKNLPVGLAESGDLFAQLSDALRGEVESRVLWRRGSRAKHREGEEEGGETHDADESISIYRVSFHLSLF